MYETLRILKRHMLKGTLARVDYFKHATHLVSYFRAAQSQMQDLDFTDMEVFNDVKELAEDSGLDLSDAFQVLTLQAGYFSVLVGGSQTLLVTADEALAAAARKRGLQVWDCVRETMPDA